MKNFLDENFILETKTAQELYHNHAAHLPIIDYHCHLPPQDVANDRRFESMTHIWLEGDHYKWRAMRANGVDERYCTGNASPWEKFEKWAETVPYTMRNPLYHWTHMELKRPFGINKILNPSTARQVYDQATEMLKSDGFTARGIMQRMNVELVCTTDDPVDSLEHHIKIKNDGFAVRVLPTWRPDMAMAVENPVDYMLYVRRLEEASGVSISQYQHLIEALRKRHDFFHSVGCRLSDHGMETFYADDYTEQEVAAIFKKVMLGKELTGTEVSKFKSAMLIEFGTMDWEKGWTQQFHVGALRNCNSRLYKELGPDRGFDSIGDFEIALPMARCLNNLEKDNKLAKTILYNLNPRDNEVIATMIGNFNGGGIPGKIQFGAAWWFLDQKDGMEKQINALSVLGLLSRFVGMLTDSRSFLSYPRHEYFRRILCNLIGRDVENGELPNDMPWLGRMVENISYHNAKEYFGF